MDQYNRNGTVRLFWNKLDSRHYGLQVNTHEPPEREPEENTYLAGMARLGVAREFLGVHTFDLAKDADCATVETIFKAMEEAYRYFAFVRMDKDGAYDGFFLSDEKPDPEYATFNMETLRWDLPENLDELKRRGELEGERGRILSQIQESERRSVRPMSDLLAQLLAGEEANAEDLEYFNTYMADKVSLRERLAEVDAELDTLPTQTESA